MICRSYDDHCAALTGGLKYGYEIWERSFIRSELLET